MLTSNKIGLLSLTTIIIYSLAGASPSLANEDDITSMLNLEIQELRGRCQPLNLLETLGVSFLKLDSKPKNCSTEALLGIAWKKIVDRAYLQKFPDDVIFRGYSKAFDTFSMINLNNTPKFQTSSEQLDQLNTVVKPSTKRFIELEGSTPNYETVKGFETIQPSK